MRKAPVSLKKNAFIRLLAITLAVVLIFYSIGVYINWLGKENVRTDIRSTLVNNTQYLSGEIERIVESLRFFMLELASDKQLMRYSIANSIMNDYERMACVNGLAEREYEIKRFSTIIESVQIMLPMLDRTIISDQSIYTDLDPELWENLLIRSEKGRIVTAEWDELAWMILPQYDREEPLFLIAISLSPKLLMQQLSAISSDRTDGMVLLRRDGSVIEAFGEGALLNEEMQDAANEQQLFVAESVISTTGFTLRCFSRVDEMMAPFTHYRATLWLLTLLALFLLVSYLLYYRAYILKPLNDMFETVRQAEKSGAYRMKPGANSDFGDISAQFNDMVDHIEQLAARVYEEEYRAQKAELIQLQMQINPHFLYNTLYMIYRIARTEGNESIANLSLHMSNYYRYITKMPNQIVPLINEVEHVTDYMEIQRMRFEPRVHIEMQPLPPEIAQTPIPSLMLQPLVENAFEHGVKDRPSDGLVSIRYLVEEESFSILVADNGGKMGPEQVERLKADIASGAMQDASALKNLYKRLQVYYGDGYRLELQSINNGLTAILTFPREGGAP